MRPRKPGAPHNIALWVGLPWEVAHFITEDGTEDGTPVNLGGAVGKALIKANRIDADAAAIAEWTVDLTADPGAGESHIALTNAESLKLGTTDDNTARYHYDLHIELADGFEFIGLWGYIDATWPTTRAAA